MANPLAVFRRNRSQLRVHRPPGALVAAGRKVDATREEADRLRRRRQAWWNDAWLFFREIGEIRDVVNKYANQIAKGRVYAAEVDTKGQVVESSNPAAIAARDRLEQGPGWSEIMRNAAIQFSVPGECYLVGRQDEQGEEIWEVVSAEEVAYDESLQAWSVAVDEKQKEPLGADGMVARLWQPAAWKRWMPDSPMRGILSSCEEIIAVESAFRAVARSRAHAGLLGLASELDYGKQDAPQEGGGDGSEASQHPLMRDMIAMMSAALGDPDSASALVPWIIEGPHKFLKDGIVHVPLAREIGDLITRLDAALGRCAAGLNVPKDLVTGIGDMNRWNVWWAGEENIKAHMVPGAELILASISGGYYRPALAAAGVDPSKHLLAFDATSLAIRPNRSTDADQALEHDAISLDTYRRDKGYKPEDAPSEDELNERLARRRGQVGEGLTVALLADAVERQVLARLAQGAAADLTSGAVNVPGSPAGTPADASPAPAGPPAQPAGEQPSGPTAPPTAGPRTPSQPPALAAAAASRTMRRTDIGSRLAAIDRDLAARLSAAAEAALRRALERAGAQLRTRAGRDKTLRQRASAYTGPAEGFAEWIGDAAIRTLLAASGLPEDEILDGAFVALKTQWDRLVPAARRQAIRVLRPYLGEAAARLELDASSPATQRGWAKLEEGMRRLALDRLHDPSPAAPAVGELEAIDGVPFAILRDAFRVASGATGETTGWDQIAVSDDAKDLLGAAGGETEAWQWEYGDFPRMRPFEPHALLDGLIFSNFDDPELAIEGSFPSGGFYAPGDHDGDLCNVVPIVLMPGEEA